MGLSGVELAKWMQYQAYCLARWLSDASVVRVVTGRGYWHECRRRGAPQGPIAGRRYVFLCVLPD